MADDLADDWFVKEVLDVDQDSDDVSKVEAVKPTPPKKLVSNKKKRKMEKDDKAKDKKKVGKEKCETKDSKDKEKVQGEEGGEEPEKKKKKKKKRKPKPKTEEEILPSSAQQLWDHFEEQMKKELTGLEMSEFQPDNNTWFIDNTEETNMSPYLKKVTRKWKKCLKDHTDSSIKASPLVLIVSSGGQRAADLLRETKDFRGEDCKCAKLFAKHFKLDEQVKYLKKNVVHLGIGTPNRILKLIEEEGLDLSHTTHVIVDWKWRDAKTRQVSNMPGVKEDLLNLFQKYLFKRCKQKKLQIGLF